MTDKHMTIRSVPALQSEQVKNYENLIKEIAMDIGKEVVHHIEIMYPQMFDAVGSSAKLSVKNCVYNQIIAAIEVNDEGEIIRRLEERKKLRRKLKAGYKKLREVANDQ
jgi:hypothetical protein